VIPKKIGTGDTMMTIAENVWAKSPWLLPKIRNLTPAFFPQKSGKEPESETLKILSVIKD
jgi:hypothetical protein